MHGDAADLAAALYDKHALAEFRRLNGGAPARRAAADHNQVVMIHLSSPLMVNGD